MKKYYSKKERQHRKTLKLIIVTFIVLILSISALLSINHIVQKDKVPQYTAEQLIHDHDGDGIPEH